MATHGEPAGQIEETEWGASYPDCPEYDFLVATVDDKAVLA
jgi:hypothetical protein